MKVLLHVNANLKARYLLSSALDGALVGPELVEEEAGEKVSLEEGGERGRWRELG